MALIKRKLRWVVEGFDENDKSVFGEHFVKVYNRPSVNSISPIRDQFPEDLTFEFGFSLHEVDYSPDNMLAITQNIKRLKLCCHDGCGNTIEEFNMVKTKLISIDHGQFNYDYNNDDLNDYNIHFKYTKSQYTGIDLIHIKGE